MTTKTKKDKHRMRMVRLYVGVPYDLEKELREARFVPVVRWVDFGSLSDRGWTSAEALVRIQRRARKAEKAMVKS